MSWRKRIRVSATVGDIYENVQEYGQDWLDLVKVFLNEKGTERIRKISIVEKGIRVEYFVEMVRMYKDLDPRDILSVEIKSK